MGGTMVEKYGKENIWVSSCRRHNEPSRFVLWRHVCGDQLSCGMKPGGWYKEHQDGWIFALFLVIQLIPCACEWVKSSTSRLANVTVAATVLANQWTPFARSPEAWKVHTVSNPALLFLKALCALCILLFLRLLNCTLLTLVQSVCFYHLPVPLHSPIFILCPLLFHKWPLLFPILLSHTDTQFSSVLSLSICLSLHLPLSISLSLSLLALQRKIQQDSKWLSSITGSKSEFSFICVLQCIQHPASPFLGFILPSYLHCMTTWYLFLPEHSCAS